MNEFIQKYLGSEKYLNYSMQKATYYKKQLDTCAAACWPIPEFRIPTLPHLKAKKKPCSLQTRLFYLEKNNYRLLICIDLIEGPWLITNR
jgi:hypothetical protein